MLTFMAFPVLTRFHNLFRGPASSHIDDHINYHIYNPSCWPKKKEAHDKKAKPHGPSAAVPCTTIHSLTPLYPATVKDRYADTHMSCLFFEGKRCGIFLATPFRSESLLRAKLHYKIILVIVLTLAMGL
jgi:hypothetical protein